jgi:hypothetical protein
LAVQTPEQQSVPTLQRTPESWQSRSQNPPEQKREQHCALFAHFLPVVMQVAPPSTGAGGEHWPDAEQSKLQHAALDEQGAASPRQAI